MWWPVIWLAVYLTGLGIHVVDGRHWGDCVCWPVRVCVLLVVWALWGSRYRDVARDL